MKLLKLICLAFLVGAGAKAENTPTMEAEQYYATEMSLMMCHSIDHRYNADAHACVYCARGLNYDEASSQCVGTLNVTGKCFGDDHYHAATKECMYCGAGYTFNEDIRECMVTPELMKEAEKKGE